MKKSEKRMLKNLNDLAHVSVHPGQIDMIRQMTEALNNSVNLLFPNEAVTHIKEVGRTFKLHWEQYWIKKGDLEAEKDAG